MPKFVVSFDLIIPGIYEVEADDEDSADEKVAAMRPKELLVSCDTNAGEVVTDGITLGDNS